ncbi:class I SAM-dependent methyltransferase [Gracilibacillus caseinilyticus]|uniref:Class I SAM-dependent methyltransferase n=1 Tax=Gracilibacillus caseinilyticus TaxID=2932256 RepID=A0ABY4EXH9_9BACI|nr:class I SAM-dependent methyltransferase [Gracilibacillus caseinilyticus]UOQ48557.1 class I SAM-dependent methyltransferase [Gracilibacillus caseinilyticus]
MKKEQFDYRVFYEEVGKENGWNFDKLQVKTEGIGWEFYQEVLKNVRKSDCLLDLGCGSGEQLTKIATSLFLMVGIDLSHSMIEKARKPSQKNVKFFQMSSEQLQFPNDFFDIVTSRHAPFSAKEVAGVLKEAGIFMTQQVSEADKINLKKAFGRGQALESQDGQLKDDYVRDLEEAGFTSVQTYEYDAAEYYQRPEDLLFLLKYTPIIPKFGEYPDDLNRFEDFVAAHQTEKGIVTNSKRFLIVAKK